MWAGDSKAEDWRWWQSQDREGFWGSYKEFRLFPDPKRSQEKVSKTKDVSGWGTRSYVYVAFSRNHFASCCHCWVETRLDRATLEAGRLHGIAKVELEFDTSLDVGDKGMGGFRDDFPVSASGEHV